VGEVQIRGRVAALLELGSGFNPQFTGRENVYLSCSLFGLSRLETDRLYPEIVNFAETEKFMDSPIRHYSSGMKARLGFAVSTSLEADIYLLDEGLSAGDVAFKEKCQDRIKGLLARDKTWIITTHNLKELDNHCSRAFLLCAGQFSVRTSLAEALTEYRKMCRSKDSALAQVRLEIDHLRLPDRNRVELDPSCCQGMVASSWSK
jgi:lipopolysaccharide transport system ATP-binding protein